MAKYQFKVEVSPTEMEAFLTILHAGSGDAESVRDFPDYTQVVRHLKISGVTCGINRDTIERLLQRRKFGDTIMVAKGTEYVPGKDGFIKYHFHVGEEWEIDPANVDCMNLLLKSDDNQVQKGDLLALHVPPEKGHDGITVTGKKIKAVAGKAVYLMGGTNTYFTDSNRRELRSSVSGVVSIKAGAVHVDGTRLLEGDLVNGSEDIDFPGHVIVLGNVEDGLKIHAGGRIEIHGNAGDVQLESGGDIIIKGTFIGRGKGEAKAAGDIQVKQVVNQSVTALGSVQIVNECENAQISAAESIQMGYYGSKVIGSTLEAKWNIAVNIVGGKELPSSALHLNQCTNVNDFCVSINDEIDKCQKELDNIETETKETQMELSQKHRRNKELIYKMRDLQEKQRELTDKLNGHNLVLKTLQGKCKKLGDPGVINVLTKVRKGTKISIDGADKTLEKTVKDTVIRNINGQINTMTKEYSLV
ncbi:hypothetical protein CEE37_00755 [candidate division LCP-89 bacterium B3_LCP]|uniref:Flagellar Assembly Protein A N-terminal region domain-containing protein n=1 Tax=candidate division LCP-89 bacterium B3_LCP TaxID=2012998 RepID=A0A532V4Y2_UNCL8|nr:MAG: hypothetical protein CEE37_00755 [candidate division LCP-89 bacterium B3_LCP]